jgi:ribosomal protein S18 acetylase RimI-like enzyme
VTVQDWRPVPSAAFAAIFAAETTRWSQALNWDTRSNWSEVETARVSGRLPGLVCLDDSGQVLGWTFFLPHNGALEIGALASTSAGMTAALLDGVLTSPEALHARSVMLFAYASEPELASHLRARGFAVERYLYLSTDLATALARRGRDADVARRDSPHGGEVIGADAQGTTRIYDHRLDARGAAALLASAYPASDPTRPFARGQRPHEWPEYLNQLVTCSGCGTFSPSISFVAQGVSPGRIEGAALMTRVADDTVHLAQLAVTPGKQGRGFAHRLLHAALAAASSQGFTRATLLVGERNVRARQLYKRLGFEEAASFVSGVCDQPTRSSSVAGGTGGVITLR